MIITYQVHWHFLVLQVQDTEEVKTWGPRGVDMPFNINNIDVTVAANGVYGTTSAILNGLIEAKILDDPEIRVCEFANIITFINIIIWAVAKPPPNLTFHVSTNRFYFFGYYQPNNYLISRSSSLLTPKTLNFPLNYISLMHSEAFKERINKQNQRKLETFEEIRF